MPAQVLRVKISQDNASLTTLFRQLLVSRDIGDVQFDVRLARYVASVWPEQSEVDRMEVFNHLKRELTCVAMSWEMFKKGLTIVGIDDVALLI
jgi:hypothetical protein